MIGNETKEKTVSTFQPSNEVGVLTKLIQKDYEVGYNIQHRPFSEFNDLSMLERQDTDQKAFNSYTAPASEDPEESWRSTNVRPITRNKLISIAAHFALRWMYPGVFAQNQDDEEDREAAEAMRDLIEVNIRNSDYEVSVLFGVVAALVNPVAYLGPEWNEVSQRIRVKTQNGVSYDNVLDEVLSGMQIHNIPSEEILITSAYQYHHQKQRSVLRRRKLDYDELEALYSEHENWTHVRPGIKSFYSKDDGVMYDQQDEDSTTLGEEVTYYNRREDMQVCYVNGIYMGEANTEENAMKHRDNLNRPKYPHVKYGYEPIDEKHFYFYKSAAFKMAPDQEEVNVSWRMMRDGTFMEVMPASAVSGAVIGSGVHVPGSMISLPLEAKVSSIFPTKNLSAGYALIDRLEKGLTESSQSDLMKGIPDPSVQTKYEQQSLEQNARVNLGLFGTMLAQMIRDLGNLMIDLILTHQTVGELDEATQGEGGILKYKSFVLPEQNINGKQMSKKIRFSDRYVGEELSEEDKMLDSFRIYMEEGGEEQKMKIIELNPELFAKRKYAIVVDVEHIVPLSKEFEEQIKLSKYDRLIANPYTDPIEVTREFLVGVLAPGKEEKLMKKTEDMGAMMGMQMNAQPPKPGGMSMGVDKQFSKVAV